jgi:serine/threonine-protein kinase HipA
MSVNGKFKNITVEDLLAEAKRFGIGSAPRVIREVRAAIQNWQGFAMQAGVPEAQLQAIAEQIMTLN